MISYSNNMTPTPGQGFQTPTSPVRMLVPTNQPFITAVESIQNAASGAGRWQHREKQPPAYARCTNKNTTVVEYGRDDERQVFEDCVIQNLWKDVREFSDRDADLLLYAFSSIIKETGGKGGAWIHAKQFLEQRGVKPMTKKEHGVTRRSGYRAEDLAAIEKSIYRLSGLWINIKEVFPPRKKGNKQRVYRHQGRMFAVMESWVQHTIEAENDTPERVPIAWKIKAGDWLMEYLTAPRYVAFLCDQSLKYDPYHEIWEKRLSRYFLFFLRINAKHHNRVLLRSIGELLQANSLPIDRVNPQKTRQRFERAMNRLLSDQQIDHWEHVPESMATLPTRKWLAIWLQWNVRLSVKSHLDAPS